MKNSFRELIEDVLGDILIESMLEQLEEGIKEKVVMEKIVMVGRVGNKLHTFSLEGEGAKAWADFYHKIMFEAVKDGKAADLADIQWKEEVTDLTEEK